MEIESLAEFDRQTATAASARRWHLQSIDLTERSATLARLDVRGALFLGCRFAPGDEEAVRRRGGLIFPRVPDVPVDPYRAELYDAAELYAGLDQGYPATPDARAYAWSQGPRTLEVTLAAALHDHAIDDALAEHVHGRATVGVMGGHALARGSDGFVTAARLGHALSERFLVATGGGPGAMEAANLGAWLGSYPLDTVDEAAAVLAATPDFDDVAAWAGAAFAVRERWPEGRASLGVPTWVYGHEPPTALATHLAKYFRNALREHILLSICRAGLVFLPGAAGTVQEIFQAGCLSYYAEPDEVIPLVLLGRDHWERELPAWPLLSTLAEDRSMAAHVHLVDHVADVLAVLGADPAPE